MSVQPDRSTVTGVGGETTADRLESRVHTLAEDIGERNVFTPSGLHQAEEYITSTWQDQGYQVSRDPYDVFFDLVAAEGRGVMMIVFHMDEADVRRIMTDPLTMIGSEYAQLEEAFYVSEDDINTQIEEAA